MKSGANIFIGGFTQILQEIKKHIIISYVFIEDKTSSSSIIKFCQKNNLTFQIANDSQEVLKFLQTKKIQIDLCVVAGSGIILKNDLIHYCQNIINFHTGDVTLNRGRHPLLSAILNKQKSMGVTVHLIDSEKIDAGKIIMKSTVAINYDKNFKYNEQKLFKLAQDMARLVMKEFKKNNYLVSYEWNVENSVYYPRLETSIIKKIIQAQTLKEL